MRRLLWSPRAIADLEAIREHIAYDSELYASLMVSRLVAAPSRLIEFPKLGRVVPEFGQADMRELVLCPYRLVYRLLRVSDHREHPDRRIVNAWIGIVNTKIGHGEHRDRAS